MANMKGPKTKGKNRLFVGETFGTQLSPKIVKTWARRWRKGYVVGPQAKKQRTQEKV